MEKIEKTSPHEKLDQFFGLHLLANVVRPASLIDMDAKNLTQSMGLSDTKQTSEPTLGPISRSGRRISMTWKVKENEETKPGFNKNCDHRPTLVSRSGRLISVSKKVKENCASNPALDNNIHSQEIVALAKILMQMHNEKSETHIWGSSKEERKYAAINLETTDRNLDEPKQLDEKKGISETTAQRSSRKRKLPSGEMEVKSRKKMKGEPHVCEICGKSFATGVQLGGHKRAHFEKEPAEPVKCWSIRKCADSELHFYLTIGKNN